MVNEMFDRDWIRRAAREYKREEFWKIVGYFAGGVGILLLFWAVVATVFVL